MLFKSLAGYLAGNLAVTLSVASAEDGKLRVTVLPKPRQKTEGDGAALATPLVLTGSPDELDANFEQLVATHVRAQQSLAEQLEATTAVIEAAKKAASSKAAKAVSKPAATAKAASAEDDDGDAGNTPAPAATALAPAPAAGAVTADAAFDF